ncbi:CD3324 family protein [Brevibacillus sp. 179-C9.3 HS]|uniref:CD3324 family protein n=1 Tax=unclassified Brevibacillus TaxID=2684853 RepID=UPI0039A1C2C6
MKCVKANLILPESLLAEIQKYVQGETIYIPKTKVAHQKWGTRTGGRKLLDERNTAIKSSFQAGSSISQLAEKYFLSTETIKKIVYTR